jgi:hypothetical protein
MRATIALHDARHRVIDRADRQPDEGAGPRTVGEQGLVE